jgi:hypothetical protein
MTGRASLSPGCFLYAAAAVLLAVLFFSTPSSFPVPSLLLSDKRSCDQMMTDHVKYRVVFFSASDVFIG